MEKKSLPIRILITAGILLFFVLCSGICAFLQEVPYGNALLYLVFQAGCVLAPGFAAICCLRIETENKVELIALSYAVGYALDIVLYLLFFRLFGQNVLNIVFWIIGGCSIAASVLLHKRAVVREKLKNKDWIILAAFVLIILAIQLFIFAFNNMAITKTGKNSYYIDLFYWASDAVTLKKQFPPINFRDFYAGRYFYHYFSSIHLAIASMFTGISVFNLAMGFAFLPGAVFLVFSAYAFYKRNAKSRKVLVIALLLFLCTTGYELITHVTIVSHLYTAPFGNDTGIAFSMLIVSLIADRILRERNKSWKCFLLATLLFMTTMGIKSPVGMMTMMVSGLICLYGLFKGNKRQKLTSFLYGVMLVCVFVLIYITVVSGMPGAGSKTSYYLNVGANYTILTEESLAHAHDSLIGTLGYFAGQLGFLIVYIIQANPAIYICFLAILACKVIFRKAFEAPVDFYIVVSIIGFLMTRFLKMEGYSQVYFSIVMVPFAVAAVVYYLEILLKWLSRKKWLHVRQAVYVAMACLILVGSGLFFDSQYFRPQMLSGLKKILSVLNIRQDDNMYMLYTDGMNTLSDLNQRRKYTYRYIAVDQDMYEACMWIKENTSPDSLIASDMIRPAHIQYPLGVMAERWIWTRNTAWLEEARTGRRSSNYRLMRDGVDYVISQKQESEDNEDESEQQIAGTVVFENETVEVLELAGAASDV